MSALNSDSAVHVLSRTEKNTYCRQRICAVRLKKPRLIIRKDNRDFIQGGGFTEYLFSALIFIISAAIIVLVAKNTASHQFKCRHCSKEFYVNWLKILVTEHSDNEYKLECPFCKIKDWCTEQKSK